MLQKSLGARLVAAAFRAGDSSICPSSRSTLAMIMAWPLRDVVIERWSHRASFWIWPPFPGRFTPRCWSWPNAFDPCRQWSPPLAGPARSKLVTTPLLLNRVPGPRSSFELVPGGFRPIVQSFLARLQFPSKGESLLDTARTYVGDGSLMCGGAGHRLAPVFPKPGASNLASQR